MFGTPTVTTPSLDLISSVFLNHVDLRVFFPHTRTRNDGKLILIFPGGLHWHQGVDIAIQMLTPFVSAARELKAEELVDATLVGELEKEGRCNY